MAIVKCPECGGQISDKAISCPHCGAPTDLVVEDQPKAKSSKKRDNRRSRQLLGIAAAIIIVVIVIGQSGKSERSTTRPVGNTETTSQETEATKAPENESPKGGRKSILKSIVDEANEEGADEATLTDSERFSISTDQARFLTIIHRHRSAYKEAGNDMAKGGVRAQRAEAICSYMIQGVATDWVGKIYDLSSNSEGRGVLMLQIGPETWAGTWNNTISDIVDNTLIDPASKIFQSAAALSEGKWVRFSGTFFRSSRNPDCLKEQSLTQSGAMTDPEFVFRFTSISAMDIQ